VRETGGVGSYIIPFPSFVDSLLRLRHGRRRRRSSGQCHCPISDRPPNRVVRARRNRRAHAEREIRSRGGGIEWEGRWAEARRGEAEERQPARCGGGGGGEVEAVGQTRRAAGCRYVRWRRGYSEPEVSLWRVGPTCFT
jgi:hypothetical protein